MEIDWLEYALGLEDDLRDGRDDLGTALYERASARRFAALWKRLAKKYKADLDYLFADERSYLVGRNRQLTYERDRLRAEVEGLTDTAKDEMSYESLSAERDQLAASLDLCRDDRKSMGAKIGALTVEIERLRTRLAHHSTDIASAELYGQKCQWDAIAAEAQVTALRESQRIEQGQWAHDAALFQERIDRLRAALSEATRHIPHESSYVDGNYECAKWCDACKAARATLNEAEAGGGSGGEP